MFQKLRLQDQPLFINLIVLSVLSLLPILFIFQFLILPNIENQWYENKYESTKNNVLSVFNTFEYYNNKIDGINYTEADAKRDAANIIKSFRYDGKNYFWINNTDVEIVAHPLRPEQEGQNVSNLTDADGKQIYVEFVKACNNSKGEGFVRYNQKKPNIEDPQPKLSYLKLYKPWGWIIGSGVYLDSVEENINKLKAYVYIIIGFGFLLSISISILMGKKISAPIILLSKATEDIANGNSNIELNYVSNNEIGLLYKNFNNMMKEEMRLKEETHQKAEKAKIESQKNENHLSECVNLFLEQMDKFSEGNLTAKLEVNNNNEIGKLFSGFNRTVSKINEIISHIVELTNTTKQSTNNIYKNTEKISKQVVEQTAQLTDVASAVEQMTATIHSTNDYSNTASEKAKVAGKIANDGGIIVSNTIEGMEEISKIVEIAAKKVNTLGQSSQQISEIINVISDIAEQTNLLALNAAIEAARAGEQGRGFAVVADEVKKLAERTTSATKEISYMINKIQLDTKDAVESINSGTIKAKEGKEAANKAGSSLTEIIDKSNEVVDVISQVASANLEQTSAANIISENLLTISNSNEETSNQIQEIYYSVEELNSLTNSLNTIVNEFILIDNNSDKEVYNNISKKSVHA